MRRHTVSFPSCKVGKGCSAIRAGSTLGHPNGLPGSGSDVAGPALPLDWVRSQLSTIRDLLAYRRARIQLDGVAEECHSLFKRFLSAGTGGSCLRLGFQADIELDLGPNWADLELGFLERRSKETGLAAIDVGDAFFDAILFTGLERISRPDRLINEVRRVLRSGGQIWVQAPLNAPYFPTGSEVQTEYWRIAPDGLRVLLQGFDEIFCSVYIPSGSALRTCSFFYGLKPQGDSGEGGESGIA